MYIQLTRNSPQPTDLGQIFVWPAGHPTILIPKPNLRFGNSRGVAGGSSKNIGFWGMGKNVGASHFTLQFLEDFKVDGFWITDVGIILGEKADQKWPDFWLADDETPTDIETKGSIKSIWKVEKQTVYVPYEYTYIYIIYRFSMVLSAYILFLRTPTWSATNLHWNSKFSQLDIHNSNPKPSDINTSILFVNNPCNGVTPLLWHHKLVPLDLSEIWFEQQRHFLVANDTSAHRIK